GIYTALNVSNAHRTFIFATDMPYLSGEFISYMAQLPDFYDVVIPNLYGNYEPLHAIYSKNCLSSIKELIDADERKIINFFDKIALREVIEDEIFFYAEDPSSIFANINYQDDITSLH
ncbi:MAG: molybdenum cofactor guanylyltransferase, partial [Spirochaetota bacterium]